MCVGMAGGQSVQGKRKNTMGGLDPAPLATNSLQWDPRAGQGSSPETIGNCPYQGPHVEGSFLLPCAQATCEPPCIGCECVCTYVCECGAPSPRRSALGCSVPLALGVPRALSPSFPCFLTEQGGHPDRLGRWPHLKGMSLKGEGLPLSWAYLCEGSSSPSSPLQEASVTAGCPGHPLD